MTTAQSWTQLLREHGPAFLSWLREEAILEKRGRVVAAGLRHLLKRLVVAPEDARSVWEATPAVFSKCNEQPTYELPGASVAYAWLHLLDRYARAFHALERLVYHNILPLARYGVRTLDIGTGPGPSGLAITDFYHALTLFAEAQGIDRLRQPSRIDCIEFDAGTNHFRHNLAESIAHIAGETGQQSVLSLCGARLDFGLVRPEKDRMIVLESMLKAEDRVWDEHDRVWTWEPRHTASEANEAAQSSFRYRLIVFSNFLTSLGVVSAFEVNLTSVLRDAKPGTVVVLLGGKGGEYPSIYDYVDRLAQAAGFQRLLTDEEVSCSELSDLVYNEGQWFYRYLQSLSPNADTGLRTVHRHFTDRRKRGSTSRLLVYRKPGARRRVA